MEKDIGLMLFGVRIDAAVAEEDNDVLRKSKSLGNLQTCDANHQIADKGYLSDGGLLPNSRTRIRQERKRGVPWSEEEHRTFLVGLEKLGKGDWRGISRNFVKTRTPTQVASHAQKYFLRQNNHNKRKRRSSLFDVGINDAAALNSYEIPTEISMKQIDAVTERSYKLSLENHMAMAPTSIPSPVIIPVSEASQAYRSTQHTENTSFLGGNSTIHSKLKTNTIYPNFLQLSLPISVQQHENSAPFSNRDLELSIAPPKSHQLPKLPAQCTAEAIWVT